MNRVRTTRRCRAGRERNPPNELAEIPLRAKPGGGLATACQGGGGEFREAGSFTPYAVQARTDDWIITLDSSSHANEGITTLRAPFFNPEEFRFTIYRAGILSDVRWALKMQDIEVGHPRFDRDFVIKGNSPERLRRLFDNENIRRLIGTAGSQAG